jgi:hypothetical protein
MINKNILEDRRRMKKIEKQLKNKKRPWYFRRYLNRTLLHWANLYLGLWIIIITLHKSPIWNMADLFMMLAAGINISIWLWGGIYNTQNDLIEELLELNKQTLKLAGDTMGKMDERVGFLTRGDDYYEV